MKRFVIEANKTIANRAPTPGQQVITLNLFHYILFSFLEKGAEEVKEVTFEEGEVYAIDIVMTTGEGKLSEGDAKTSTLSLP